MNIEEYKKMLANHDWFYDFSDDHRFWLSGSTARSNLINIAEKNGDEYKRAYNEEHAKCFNNPHFVSKYTPYQAPFPEVS